MMLPPVPLSAIVQATRWVHSITCLRLARVERVPTVLGGLENRRQEDSPGIVNQNSYRSQFPHRAGKGGIDLFRVADVGREAEPTDLVRRATRSLEHRAPRSPPRRRRRRESAGDPPADSRSTTGHDSHLVGEQH